MAVISTTFKLVDEISDKLSNLGTAGQNVQKELENIANSASSLDNVSTNAEKASEAITETADAVREYEEWHRNSLDALTDYVNGVDGAEEALNQYIGKTEEAEQKTEGLDESIEKAGEGYESIGEKVDDTTNSTEEFGNTNEAVFGDLEGLLASAGIIAFLDKVVEGYEKCIEVASEYETSVAKVSTLADPNVMSISDMSDDMLELSQKTGQAVTALAEAEYQALSAGVATDKATQFVEQANELAVGGFTEQATAVDVLTTALNAYQLDVSETDRISNVLLNTQNKGKTTVDELAQNMGRVIPSAAAYNVEIEDLGTAYAILTANGIATAESTTYLKGMFNELGDTGSTVSATLQEETGKSFAQLKDEGNSLGDIIGILSNSVNGNATAFANLWSSQEAGIGALSLLTSGTEKYNSVLDSMKNSTGTAAEAYEKMTGTAEHSSQALSTAAANAQTAIGTALLPASTKLNEAMTTTLNGITSFVGAHPSVVHGLTAISVAIGVVTTAIVGYNVVTKLATVATTALTAVMDANPVFLLATAIAALVGGLATLIMTQEDEVDEMEGMTASTKLLKEQLDETTSAYDEACEKYGENSAEAEELKYKVDELSDAYANGQQSVEDFTTKCDEAAEAFRETRDQYYSTKEDIDNEEESTANLVDRLQELATKSKLSAAEQAELSTVIAVLNNKIPGLNVSLDDVNNSLADTITKIKSLSAQNIAEDRYNNAFESYNELLEDQPRLIQNAQDAAAELTAAQTLYNEKVAAAEEAQKAYDKALEEHDTTSQEVQDASLALAEAQGDQADALKDYNRAVQDMQEKNEDYNECLRATEEALGELTDAYAEQNGIIIDSSDEAQEAAATAAVSQSENLQTLAEAYDEAYQAALESFQGQYSLWDEVGDISETSASTLMSNLDTQITYWQNYADNLENLQSRNIEGLNELVASMDDGSEESAAALAGMASASDEELQKIVSKYTDLQSEQDRTASNAAEMQTNFSSELDTLSGNMKTAIDDMELSDEASAAAKATIDAYVAQIRAGIDDASSAASAVATATASALSSVNSSIPKHASGTDYGEDIYIAGEEGPELIVGREGSKVYTAEETKQILSQSFNVADPYASISNSGKIDVMSSNFVSGDSSTIGDRTITIKLEGIGSIQIGGSSGVCKEELIDFLAENIKPVLISVINDEIYEEGEDTYEY